MWKWQPTPAWLSPIVFTYHGQLPPSLTKKRSRATTRNGIVCIVRIAIALNTSTITTVDSASSAFPRQQLRSASGLPEETAPASPASGYVHPPPACCLLVGTRFPRLLSLCSTYWHGWGSFSNPLSSIQSARQGRTAVNLPTCQPGPLVLQHTHPSSPQCDGRIQQHSRTCGEPMLKSSRPAGLPAPRPRDAFLATQACCLLSLHPAQLPRRDSEKPSLRRRPAADLLLHYLP